MFPRPWTLCLSGWLAGALSLTAAQTGTPQRVLGADDSTGRLAIVAPDGTVEWETKVGAIHDATVLPNGNLLFQQGWTRIVEMSPDLKGVWEYDAAKQNGNAGRRVEVHAFERLPNGLTMIAESGRARIIEVDKAGRIQNEFRLRVNHPNAHSDTRLVRRTPAGTYLVAHESDGFVREYLPNGVVVWEFEVPLFGGTKRGGHGPEGFGNSVFSAVRLPNGNTLIGAGNGHRVLEVNPKKEIVWQIAPTDLPGITLAWVTRVERPFLLRRSDDFGWRLCRQGR